MLQTFALLQMARSIGTLLGPISGQSILSVIVIVRLFSWWPTLTMRQFVPHTRSNTPYNSRTLSNFLRSWLGLESRKRGRICFDYGGKRDNSIYKLTKLIKRLEHQSLKLRDDLLNEKSIAVVASLIVLQLPESLIWLI